MLRFWDPLEVDEIVAPNGACARRLRRYRARVNLDWKSQV
jgi:hypothetical protein